MTKILLATTNEGKLREASAVLQGLPIELICISPNDWPVPIETGSTFAQNARLKAIHYSQCAGCWALADDSGLVVDALGGAPGVHSARYAGPNATDRDNNHKLIVALRDVPLEMRTARFCCAAALADGPNILALTDGTWEGLVVDEPRGANGFGYDPLFFVPSEGCAAAELPPETKNALSHRGRAFRAMRYELQSLLT